jgi:hypothetical protein
MKLLELDQLIRSSGSIAELYSGVGELLMREDVGFSYAGEGFVWSLWRLTGELLE